MMLEFLEMLEFPRSNIFFHGPESMSIGSEGSLVIDIETK